MPLSDDDAKHLTAAQGYCELGMFLEANEELESIDPFCRHLPEVLAVRLRIYQGLGKWELMEAMAEKLFEYDPDGPQWVLALAYATRRCKSIEAATPILRQALERHPEVAMIAFNLACYECQVGEIEAAKDLLARCFKIDPFYRISALEDPDLEPLWDSL